MDGRCVVSLSSSPRPSGCGVLLLATPIFTTSSSPHRLPPRYSSSRELVDLMGNACITRARYRYALSPQSAIKTRFSRLAASPPPCSAKMTIMVFRRLLCNPELSLNNNALSQCAMSTCTPRGYCASSGPKLLCAIGPSPKCPPPAKMTDYFGGKMAGLFSTAA
jgi:hypothetical protein